MALPQVQRVLAIPVKRLDRPVVGFLSHEEIEAILNAPDRSTWKGKRDHALLATIYDTGARVPELIVVGRADAECRHCTAGHLYYRVPASGEETAENLALMRLIDEEYTPIGPKAAARCATA
jgi:integrase